MESSFTFPRLNVNLVQLMERHCNSMTAITFDEVTLQDQPSDYHPNDVQMRSFITPKISLKGCGLMSAAMDTVTEARMALAMAKMGGIGIIHRNLSPSEQAQQVKWVRKKINYGGMIDKPFTFLPTDNLSILQNAIHHNEWQFTSFPIVDEDNKLVGLMTRDEMDFVEDGNPVLRDIMKPLGRTITASEGTTSEQAYSLMKQNKVKKLPVVDSQGHLRGLYVWNDVKSDQRKREKFSLDDEGHFLVGAAVGFAESEMERVDLLVAVGCRLLVLDSSHGACKPAREQLERIHGKYPGKLEVIVGNIASYESAMYLLEGKVKPDALKVGIGPGSICTTRQVTGHGVPQLTAVYRVWKAVYDYGAKHGYYIPIIADGGIRSSGDIVKCLAVGATGFMMGSTFAGAEESPGKVIMKNGKQFKTIRGMGSRSAMEERSGSRIRYHRNETTIKQKDEALTEQQKIKVVPEGVEGLVEFKGTLERIMLEFLGGIQSGLAHSGGGTIAEFQSKAQLWLQSSAGITEGKPHSIFSGLVTASAIIHSAQYLLLERSVLVKLKILPRDCLNSEQNAEVQEKVTVENCEHYYDSMTVTYTGSAQARQVLFFFFKIHETRDNRMKSSVKAEMLFLAFMTLLGATLGAVPPLQEAQAGASLPPCAPKAYYFDVVGSQGKPFIFVLEMVPATKANWNMYLTRDNPETPFGVAATCAIDSVVGKVADFPNSLVIEKSCGDVEGRWYVIVESDSPTVARFTFKAVQSKVLIPANLVVGKDAKIGFPVDGTKTGPLLITNAIERWDFYNISIPSNIPFGSNVLIEISSSVSAPLSTRLSYAGDTVNSRCRSTRSFDKYLEIPFCEARQGGSWRLTIGRSVANQSYKVKAYFETPSLVPVKINEKVAFSLSAKFAVVYFSFSGPWPAGELTLVPVIDNVVGGEAALQANYDVLPYTDCAAILPGCTTNRGCHVIIPPCKTLQAREKAWYAGVQVSNLKSPGTPLTFTFSWTVYPVVPKTVTAFDPIIGDLRNGELKHFFLPAQVYSVTGTWLKIHVYIDSTRRNHVVGLNGYLYISNRKNPGPEGDGCSSYTKLCSIAQTKSDYMSCSIQLDPCELSSQYVAGVFFSLIVVEPRDELWFQEDLSYTINISADVVPTERVENSPFLLDTGDVVTGVVAENQYTFFRVPSHKGSVTIALSSPDYYKPPSEPTRTCLDYTIGGVTECVGHSGCGWCKTCVPCTGKIGDVVYCAPSNIFGCSESVAPPTDDSILVNPVFDNCSPLGAAMCTSEGLSGVCGWCGSSSSCGSCVRNLVSGAGQWCLGEVPKNCEKARLAPSKRAITQFVPPIYKPLQLQLIISYDAAYQGPSCECWKPVAILDVKQGDLVKYTLDSCRAENKKPLYVGIRGVASTNYTTPFMCILAYLSPLRLNAQGDVECMSLDGVNCLSDAPCLTTLANVDPKKIVPVTCGEYLRKQKGFSGYDTPSHWCAVSLAYFDERYHSYAENPYTISVKEYTNSTFDMVTLKQHIRHESSIGAGDTNYIRLDFNRTNVLRKLLVVKVKGHPNTGITSTLGFLEGDPTDMGKCYRFAAQQKSCTFTEENGGLCILKWGRCDWIDDTDSRPFVLSVHRTGKQKVALNNAADLYNVRYEIIKEEERALELGKVVPEILHDGLYHYYNLTLPAASIVGKQLVIEAYYDAGRQLAAGESLSVFMNMPEWPSLAGDIRDCLCNQEVFSDPQKVLIVLDECDITAGTYHLSVQARQRAVDPSGAKYTLTAYLRDPVRRLIWDVPTDYSAFLEQRSQYRFELPSSMIEGKTNPNTTLTISLSTYNKDVAVLTLHKGNESACGCHSPVAECSTGPVVAGRPTCQLQIDYCQLWGDGDYFVTVTPRLSTDKYTPMSYTLWASTTITSVNTIVKLAPTDENCLSASATTNYALDNLRIQHFALDNRAIRTDEVFEVYITNLRYGSLKVAMHDTGLATPQCMATDFVRCLPDNKYCIIQLACPREIKYLSVTAKSLENNEVVKFSVSSCISKPTRVALNKSQVEVQVSANGSKTLEINLNEATSATPTFALKMEQTSGLSYNVTLDQGQCSGCTFFTRAVRCGSGVCWLFLHWFELPANWQKTRFLIHIDNPDTQNTLATLISFVTVNMETPIPLTTNNPSTVSIAPGSWSIFQWRISAAEAAKGAGLRTGSISVQVIQPVPVPDLASDHRVTFDVTKARLNATDKLVLSPAKGGAGSSDSGLESISVCCLTAGDWYAYVWNGNPSTAWTVTVAPSLSFVTNHVTGKFGEVNQIRVPKGSAITNVAIPFSGLGTVDPGARLYAEIASSGADPSSSILYYNLNGPAGPRTSCTSNIEQVGGLMWTRDWYSCFKKPLVPTVYWFGLSAGSVDREYSILLAQSLPTVVPIVSGETGGWSEPVRSSPTRYHQFRFDLQRTHKTFGVQLVAQIEIVPESLGSVTMLWNIDQAADSARDCSNNRGQVVATRTSPTAATAGKAALPSCLEAATSIYLGVVPSCVTGDCTNPLNNPLYRVRIVALDVFPDTTFNIGGDKVLQVTEAKPGEDRLFVYNGVPQGGDTQYIRLLASNIQWKSTVGNLTIDWIQDGSCQMHTGDDDCNTARTTCAAIIFPCEYTPTNVVKFKVSTTQTVSYSAVISVLGNTSITPVNLNQERKVFVKEEALAIFRVNIRNNITLVGPGDKVRIALSDVSCGRAKAWINRGYGAGPGCKLAEPCSSGNCVLWESSACNLMLKDVSGDFYITVRGLDQFTNADIAVRLQVSVVPDGEAPTKFVTVHDNEEHKFYARVLEAPAVDAPCTTEALPQFASCCSATKMISNNDTRHWVHDDSHFVYTIEGGHHLGYGAVITVGVRDQVERVSVIFSPDYPFFCGSRPTQTFCVATPSKPCTYQVNSCVRSTRQIYVYVNPDTAKWVTLGRPTVAPLETIYQTGWIRVDNKEVALFDVAPTDKLSSEYFAQFHPFWLLPGEQEYIQISHPVDYATETNYHVRIEVEEIFGGVVEITQDSAWTPCVSGECTLRECITRPFANECVLKYGPCRCDNFNQLAIPPCYSPDASGNVEQFDDDRADHIGLRALGTGSTEASAVRGRIRFRFFEEEEDINAKKCEVVKTGATRFFNPKIFPKPDQIYKFTVSDMEEDYGGVRMSVNDNKVALAGVSCAETAYCRADGNSCSILYRRSASSAPRVAVKGDQAGLKYFGDHHFYLEASLVTVDIVDLTIGTTSVSPILRVTGENCLKPSAPEFYRYRASGNSDFVVVRLVAHNARAWINQGYVTYGWGQWVCDGRMTGGVCETVIACNYNKTGVYYIHVEGSSHELTVFEHKIETVDVPFGGSTVLSRFSSSPYYAVRLTGAEVTQDDPMKNIRITIVGQILQTWITANNFGDKSCRIPGSSDVYASDALYGDTFVHTIPACHIPVVNGNNTAFVANILRKFHRSGDSTCINYDFAITSQFVVAHSALQKFDTANANPYNVFPDAGGVAKALHKVNVGPLSDSDVVYAKILRSNVPVTHVVWKSNYIKTPNSEFCSRDCASVVETSGSSWLDKCWHCGGGSYDTVFVEVTSKEKSDVTLVYDLEVTRRSFVDISSAWVNKQLRGTIRDHSFFRHNVFNRTVGNAFEILVTSGIGVEVEVYPADCHRREGALDLQPIVYRCFPGHICDISFPQRNNFGSKSTKESRIWADDSLRIVVKGYNTDFQIRSLIRRELCRPAPLATLTPYCASHLNKTTVWGTSDVTWTGQDQWANSFANQLIQHFDCPADQKCQCKPVSDFCKHKIRSFACEYAFGTCSPDGFRRTARVNYCSEVEGACGRSFTTVGLGWLDCRHAYYYGQKILTREDGCDIIEGCPPIKPPTPPPSNRTPSLPPIPEPTPTEIEDTGLTLAAKLGIALAFLAILILISLIFYFGVVSPRVAFRNTIEGEGYEIM